MRLIRSLIAAAAVAFSVTACAAPAPAPEVAPTGPQTPPVASSPAASPAAESAAAEIVFHADRLVVLDGEGTQLTTTSLVTDRDDVVGAIVEVLGESPEASEVAAMTEQRAGTSYDWDGLSVYLAAGEWPDFTADVMQIAVTAPSINGVSLRTASGVAVGAAADQFDPDASFGTFDGLSYFRTETVVVGTSADAGFSSDPVFPLEWSISVVTDGITVTRLNLPSTNYGV